MVKMQRGEESETERNKHWKRRAEKKLSGALQIFRLKRIYKCGSRVKPHL